MAKAVRVRYAPSPTGHLHIGNARTALFNYLYARHYNGKFIIRIEDTDIKRNVPGGEESQLTYLKWLGIDWDEGPDKGGDFGPYRQTERLEIYRVYWQKLVDKGLAYRCYCTEEELELEREEQVARNEMPMYSGKHRDLTREQQSVFEAEGRVPSIRLRVPPQQTFSFNDMVKGEVSFESNGIGDFVIVKKDGIPTYNFAVVIDDHLMEISHVLRGDDHITNTPRQLMIYEALGWEAPIFGHMTLIVNEQRKKLSKRDESIIQFISQYEELGYLPEAMFNFIALLGWSPEGEEEIFTREQLVEIFNSARLSKSPAVFDTDKLNWLNHHYLKKADPATVVNLSIPHLERAGLIAKNLDPVSGQWVVSLVGLLQEKMKYAAEIVSLSDLFFRDHIEYDDEAKGIIAEDYAPTVLKGFLSQVEQAEEFSAESIKSLMKNVQKETGYKGKELFMTVRAALTGQIHGPDLNQSLYLLGRDKVINRLKNILLSS